MLKQDDFEIKQWSVESEKWKGKKMMRIVLGLSSFNAAENRRAFQWKFPVGCNVVYTRIDKTSSFSI